MKNIYFCIDNFFISLTKLNLRHKKKFRQNIMVFQFILTLLLLMINFPTYSFKPQSWDNSGVRVLFHPTAEIPMVNIKLAFAAGSAYDQKNYGLAQLTAKLLNQGNGIFTADEIAEKLAKIGAQYNSTVNQDMAVFSLATLNKDEDLEKAIDIFTLIVGRPNFPEPEFLRIKSQQLIEIKQAYESPVEIANELLMEKLYKNHPYDHLPRGKLPTVAKINLTDVRNFYQKYYRTNNAYLVIVGSVTKVQATKIAEKIIKNINLGSTSRMIPLAQSVSQDLESFFNFPSTQTVLRLGQIGINYHDEDYFSLVVGNYILGGGSLVSILAQEIRDRHGLSYGVSSKLIPLAANGPFVISLSTKSNSAAKALTITKDLYTKFIAEGPTQESIAAAQKYLIGNFPLTIASNDKIAYLLLCMAFYNLPADFLENYTQNISKVTLDQVKFAMQKHNQIDKTVTVMVGKSE